MDAFFPKPRKSGLDRGDEKDAGVNSGEDKRGSRKDKGRDDKGLRDKWAERRTVKELIYGLAGFIGISPRLFTFRQLVWMADGKDHNEWFQVARIVCEIHNVNCTKKSDCIDFRHVHPHFLEDIEKESDRGPTVEEVSMIKKELSSWQPKRT